MIPKTTLGLAKQIIRSWERGGNTIVVAAPLTEPLDLWNLLRKPGKACPEIQLPLLCTAYLDPGRLRSKADFVRMILGEWGVTPPKQLDDGQFKTVLWRATEAVRERNAIPLLLIPKFDDAIRTLDENIGYILRDIQHSLGLRTVVALPRTYHEFLEWLKASSDEYSPFLNSEFGQGHRNVALLGYSREETKAILEGLRDDVAEAVYSLSGGVPALVKHLRSAAYEMDAQSLRKFARDQTSRGMFQRFLNWLDKPKHNINKRLVTEKFTGIQIMHSEGQLESHDWEGVLLDGEGNIRSEMIGWACSEAYWKANPEGLPRLFGERLELGDACGLTRLLASANAEYSGFPEYEAANLVAEFQVNADPFGFTWDRAASSLNRILDIAKKGRNKWLSGIADGLVNWRPLTAYMDKYCGAKASNRSLRAEEYFIRHPDGVPALRAYLQFLALRLKIALKFQPAPARQSVLALPENILQAYGFAKLGLPFWSAPALNDAVLSGVRNLPWRGGYDPPKTGTSMSFEDMLVVGWVTMCGLPAQQRLFESLEDLTNLRDLYRQARGPGAHSVDIVSSHDWKLYREGCETLLRRAAATLLTEDQALELPDPLGLLHASLQGQ